MLLPLAFLSFIPGYLAAKSQRGEQCDPANYRMQIGTFQLVGDCEVTDFCDGSSHTCVAKGCRRDEFPFGYPPEISFGDLPEFCKNGEFCSDEEDRCQPLLAVGSPCQLNRDDQCQPPENFRELSQPGLNVNGSVCINNRCMWSNVTVGLPCEVENTAYITYGRDGEFINPVSRGNCIPGLYCDAAQRICMQTRALGDTCTADKECSSHNCLPSLVCGEPPDAPQYFPIWVYIIVGIGIIGGMLATLILLFLLHRRARDEDREKRTQYWREQTAFRQNILQMKETAQASLLSLPFSGSGTNTPRHSGYGNRDHITSEDSQIPMLPQSNKQSGLRNNMSDDDREDIYSGDERRTGSRRKPSRRLSKGGRI